MIEFLALALAAQDVSGQPSVTALIGATIIDGTGQSFEDGAVIIEGDRILCAGDCMIPVMSEIINVEGRFITPGLVDAHVHYGQTAWLDGRPSASEPASVPAYADTIDAMRETQADWDRAFLCSGITAVFDVGGQPWTVAAANLRDGLKTSPHRMAAGPLVTQADVPSHNLTGQPTFLTYTNDDELRANVQRVIDSESDALKIWYLTPSEEDRERLDAAVMTAGAMAREAGLPMIVHATTLREAKVALQAGATMLVHGVFDQPVDQEFLDLMVSTGASMAPTIIPGPNWTRALAAVTLMEESVLDDPNHCLTAHTRERVADFASYTHRAFSSEDIARTQLAGLEAQMKIIQDNLKAVHEAGGLVAVGTDAGNPLTTHGPSIYEEMALTQAAGISPMDVITMTTLNGAKALWMDDEIGTLESGKVADLLVLSEDPRKDVSAFRSLTHVMRGGVLYEQAELQAAD